MTAPDHLEDEPDEAAFGVLTVSTSRTLEDDRSGDAIVQAIEDDGRRVVARELVDDDREAIRAMVLTMAETEPEAVVVTGGTGLGPDDVTVEAVAPLCDRTIPGFGELFRLLSYEDIGPNALLSRARAGVIETVPVFCLPGSTQGATVGTTELVLPTITHVLAHTQPD